MSKQRPKPTKSGEPSPVIKLSADPATDPAAARQIHASSVPGAIYGDALRYQLEGLFKGLRLAQSAHTYVEDLIRRMDPRDPMEEMLVAQALMAHARVLHLTKIANRQTCLDSVRIVNEHADKASNTFRRLMLALHEYRKPPRGGDSFTAIRQANIAGQQVVMNGKPESTENATNEQGFGGAGGTGCGGSGAAAIPAEPGRSGVAPGLCSEGEALGAVHRPADNRRQSEQQSERRQTRAAVGGRDPGSA